MGFMEIDPQPARGKLAESMWKDEEWIAEEKYDGERRIAQFCGKVVRFTGRRSKTTGKVVEKSAQLPHLSGLPLILAVNWKGKPPPPPAQLDGTVLDGELILPDSDDYRAMKGGRSKMVTSIANSLPEEAIKKQLARGWLRYVVFDCLYWKGEDIRHLPWAKRREYAGCAVRTWGNSFVTTAVMTVGNKKKYYDDVIATGGEGVILKHMDHVYGDEKRWVKVKKCATADVVIIGYKMAKAETKKKSGEVSRSRIAGKVGSVEIGQYKIERRGLTEAGKLVSVGFARGFSDQLMDNFTDYPKRYIGRVITIEANDREPTGKFRHPRVVDPETPFRKDKDPKSCIFDLNER